MSLGVAIIGCGLIGHKRAQALGTARLVACVDVVLERAQGLARQYDTIRKSDRPKVSLSSDWREVIHRSDVDVFIVATTNNILSEVTKAAMEAGKHVLVEKPGARHILELRDLPIIAANMGVQVRVGFNHRYHRAFQQARQIVDSGALGPLMFLRARYGHGGRIGYDNEWRADPAISGGGELIDQGVHLIDLARWFLGDFTEVYGYAQTYFWDMPVDDNSFMLLKTLQKQVAFLHVSCTEWKNTFSWELYGRNGKLQVDGLGGSYGVERLSWYKMLPEMGPPETMIWEYPMADNSWEVEMMEFLEDIRLSRQPAAGLLDAMAALDIVGKIYKESGYDHCT